MFGVCFTLLNAAGALRDCKQTWLRVNGGELRKKGRASWDSRTVFHRTSSVMPTPEARCLCWLPGFPEEEGPGVRVWVNLVFAWDC